MIITVIAHERNLGVLTLTDFLLETLGKDNTAVVGSNYCVENLDPILKKIDDFTSQNKNVIMKYVVPKMRFSNQSLTYPSVLNEISDVVLRAPTFMEEIKPPINLEVFKGLDNPLIVKINKFYEPQKGGRRR